jgi:hypothetical protein
MMKVPADRSQGVPNRAAGGGKSAQNAKKILNRGNEPKNLLTAKELAFSGAQNELVFERSKRQSKLEFSLKATICEAMSRARNWKLEIRNSKLENGNRREELAVATPSFDFPLSVFDFRISTSQFPACAKCCRLFDHWPPKLLYWEKTFLKFESK